MSAAGGSAETVDSNTSTNDSSGGDSPPTRTRRGSRGGRRSRSGSSTAAAKEEANADAASDEAGPASTATAKKPAPKRAPRGQSRRKADRPEEASDELAAESESKPEPKPRRSPRSPAKAPAADISTLAKAIEKQSREIESLRQAISDQAKGSASSTPESEVRVGVFIDSANAEKGREERHISMDWKNVLQRLVAGRRIARAVAYSPISDDPAVSIETQRFVEPFLDSGYRIVTKPLKRFQGGAIKANLDIEIALDIMQMLDRLDVVCLVSGDGDFEPLVETVQGRGIRVEIASFPHNTATNLRNAADEFIDLSKMRS